MADKSKPLSRDRALRGREDKMVVTGKEHEKHTSWWNTKKTPA